MYVHLSDVNKVLYCIFV